MLRPSLITGALLGAVLATGSAYAVPTDDGTSVQNSQPTSMILASGDSAGRGPDTSKGAVPKDPAAYPSGTTSAGDKDTSGTKSSAPGTSATGTTGTGTTGSGMNQPETGTSAPGTGMKSPGTTQQGGTVRTDK